MPLHLARACAILVLLATPALAQRDAGTSGDPTINPAGDPQRAFKPLSKASELGSKLDETTTNVAPANDKSKTTGVAGK